MTPLEEKEVERKLKELKVAIGNSNKIRIVKCIQAIAPNYGLLDAKKLAEAGMYSLVDTYDYIADKLSDHLPHILSKEQFLQILGNAIDQAEKLYSDPLEMVIFCCENLKQKGGLRHAASQADKFINAI